VTKGTHGTVATRGSRLAAALALVLATLVGAADARPVPGPDNRTESVAGLLLVANPGMPDPRFAETVIYMVEHDAEGAFGLVVNRLLTAQEFDAFLDGIGVEADDPPEGHVLLHAGGPVQPEAGFVLHTADYADAATIPVDGRYAMTAGQAIMRAIAEGRGPRRFLIAFGYAGWASGQLEGEMAGGGWVTSSAEEAILFDDDFATKWRRAFDAHGMSL
jgi:putative transcriptional regulator